jgi:hypothetical protein
MSTPYAGTATFPATIPVLADGDAADAGTWGPALEGLADRTIYLRSPGVSLARLHPMTLVGETGFALSAALISQTASSGLFNLMLSLPHGATLTQLEFSVDGAGGHGGVLPTMPVFTFYSVAATGAQTTIATVTDTSANTGIYEAEHKITSGVLATVIDAAAARYSIRFVGEGGGSYQAGLTINSLKMTFTVADTDQGAA